MAIANSSSVIPASRFAMSRIGVVESAVVDCELDIGDLRRVDGLAVDGRLVDHERAHRNSAQSGLQRNDRPVGVGHDVRNTAGCCDDGAQIVNLAIERVLRAVATAASATSVIDPHAVVLGQSQLDERERSDAVERSMNEHQRVPLARLADRQLGAIGRRRRPISTLATERERAHQLPLVGCLTKQLHHETRNSHTSSVPPR